MKQRRAETIVAAWFLALVAVMASGFRCCNAPFESFLALASVQALASVVLFLVVVRAWRSREVLTMWAVLVAGLVGASPIGIDYSGIGVRAEFEARKHDLSHLAEDALASWGSDRNRDRLLCVEVDGVKVVVVIDRESWTDHFCGFAFCRDSPLPLSSPRYSIRTIIDVGRNWYHVAGELKHQ